VVAFDDATVGSKDKYTLQLPVFLHESEEQVKLWLANDQIDDVQDFIYIAAAYLSLYEDGQVPEDMLKLLEKTVENNALSITPDQAINMVQIFSQSGSTYTMELLDRIIGTNIDDIPA